MPMRTGGSLAIQGSRSCRNKRLAISIPRTCISCFIGLASCGSIGSLIVNSLWLIAVDPHRGGSISLRPHLPRLERGPGREGGVAPVLIAGEQVHRMLPEFRHVHQGIGG